MVLIKICSLALIGLVLTVVIKQWKSDWLPLVRVALLVLFAMPLLSLGTPLIDFLRELGEIGEFSEEITLLLRALGIAVLAQVVGAICRECGESGIADAVELAGKLELLLLCIPLMNELLTLARELLSSGGSTL